jgi:hypothetical protein
MCCCAVMAYPDALPGHPELKNQVEAVACFLKTHHPNAFLLFNLSEERYDYGPFDDQVLEFSFPGHPAPPLGMLFKICFSIESWLKASPESVAVIHCLVRPCRAGGGVGWSHKRVLAWVSDGQRAHICCCWVLPCLVG